MPTIAQWRSTWDGLGVAAPEGLYDRLIASYSEPRRKYHTTRHLDECLAKFSEVRSQAIHPQEIELAIWFHDAVYDTKLKDNEEKSAEWARSAMLNAGIPGSIAERVRVLVMATRHDAIPEGGDAQILVDVDLSILGAAADRFEEYERHVREEYAWVPDRIFRHERRKILKAFLARRSIYGTTHFRETHERQARENLRQSLKRLGKSRAAALRRDEIIFYAALAAFVAAGMASGISCWIVVSLAVVLSMFYGFVVEPKFRAKHTPVVPAPRASAESKYTVRCTDEGIAVLFEGKLHESVRWDEILIVGIRIDDSFLPQPWWVVGGGKGGCMFPSDAKGWEIAHHEMSERLPGFDHKSVIQAAGMMSGGVVVWEKTRQNKPDAAS